MMHPMATLMLSLCEAMVPLLEIGKSVVVDWDQSNTENDGFNLGCIVILESCVALALERRSLDIVWS